MASAEVRRKHRAHFMEFWSAYPRKQAVTAAEHMFSDVVERGTDPVILIAKARAFARNVDPDRLEYVPMPHKWLQDGRYEDNDLFTDQAAAEKEWLRGCYQRCDQSAVENRYRIKMPRVNLPDDVTDPDEIRQWYRRRVQSWILEVVKKVENE